ncbi:MAG: amino acid adenylation domain-containing protein, partial [Candidatus Aminicenantes bacterium]|nr:amino acid adenylation domain-containing protein [Candidatus Aminicenantes bacterium]
DMTFNCEIRTRTGSAEKNASCAGEKVSHPGGLHEYLYFAVEYCSALFMEETVNRFISYFKHIVTAVTGNPELRIEEIEILSEEEKKRLLYDFNDTKVDYPRDKSIARLFQEQVSAAPDAVASIDLSRAGSIVSLTYKELAQRVESLARLSAGKGLRSGAVAALMTERSTAMIVGILAILKAGAAYLPIDSAYPEERKQYMLMDSSAVLLLTTRSLIEAEKKSAAAAGKLFGRWPGATIFIEEADAGHQQPGTAEMEPGVVSAQAATSPLAYIMYTSGSTGNPKGVMVEHRNVVRLVKNSDFIELSAWTRILQTGAPVFDATTFEIWGSLLNGGRLYLVSRETILDVYDLGREINRHKINTLWLSSPLFNRLMQQDSDSGILRVSYLLVGGDVLSPKYINLARKKNKALKIINGYGPTENTTFSTTYLIDRDFRDSIPIGRPITNSTAYIVDKNGRLQPPGIWGELLVGGDGLSRGYLNNPELTAEKFQGAAHPPSENPAAQPSTVTLYRTGDLARWTADGTIEFLGRVDTQVKIRGYRVEIGEIERQLLKHDSVKDVVILVRVDKKGEKYLCAYVVVGDREQEAGGKEESGEGVSSSGLRQYLSRILPDYMAPAFFVFLD